jgi:hypothetical protein
MENGSLRHTDVLLGLKCSNCGETLSMMPGRTQITFQCKSGHFFPMRQLFQMQGQDVDRGLRKVVGIWEEKIGVLQRSAEIAHREGRVELAQTFLRELDQVASRMQVVRNHLGEAPEAGAMAG